MQERASSALVLLECLKETSGLAPELAEMFVGELNPVAPKAQRKVQRREQYLETCFCFCFIIEFHNDSGTNSGGS